MTPDAFYKGGSYMERPRINQLLENAVKLPLTVVCAGAGYGKTRAVYSFVRKYCDTVLWMQLSELDNMESRFWENYTYALSQFNSSFASMLRKFSFPPSEDEWARYFAVMRSLPAKKRLVVMDDVHLISSPVLLDYADRFIKAFIPKASVILISRTEPSSKFITELMKNNKAIIIDEKALRFTENELAAYFRQLGVPALPHFFEEISRDTDGWAMAVNLIGRSMKKNPSFEGYVRSAMKINIFSLIENEIFLTLSGQLRNFLIRLSLIDHLDADLVALIADDASLLDEMEKISAYIRYDMRLKAYLIHHLFLEYLRERQGELSEEEKKSTYQKAANWCVKNNYKVDAISYYAHMGDYSSISILTLGFGVLIPGDILLYLNKIFESAPPGTAENDIVFPAMRLKVLINLGWLSRAMELAVKYEAMYLAAPDGVSKHVVLSSVYICMAYIRAKSCIYDHCYDFDIYYAKAAEQYLKYPYFVSGTNVSKPVSPWASLVGIPDPAAMREYLSAVERAVPNAAVSSFGAMSGEDSLSEGVLFFYQNDLKRAENLLSLSAESAKANRQFDILHRSLFYSMRIAFSQGKLDKAGQFLDRMKDLVSEQDYTTRKVAFDIALGWYYLNLRIPEFAPDWIRGNFSRYNNPADVENFENQVKMRCCYFLSEYSTLLAYIEEQLKLPQILFGRLEMLALQAVCLYHTKARKESFAALEEACKLSSPNRITMPFAELGKDMRTLTAAAMKDPERTVSREWLSEINRKSAAYARQQSLIIAEYRKTHKLEKEVELSRREKEILLDLSQGLSRSEIAADRNISENTVKTITDSVYSKLGASSLIEAIRIATEEKLI
ncbi:MAG: LuxR C-terminal-related transcriptional regulator [Oscillospiraceae bacterium]|nr:LuxR C-terminal-related transcriptional regulator [Oscillospiraceae bacterium]